ncbi:MAG: tRNA (adenosine(37)-N6)-dimethylallyltransferase MiaA [Opitutaceae bacterium]
MTDVKGNADRRPTIWLITGCTASGKTDLSIACAEFAGAEIVSCDALLFYRGMDVGTAKPSLAERARVPHHLIDVLDPLERMDVKRYIELASQTAAAITARGRRVIVAGGSGFYLKSFLAPVADDVPVDRDLRAELEEAWRRDGLPSLVARLHALNPRGLDALDTRNPRRVLRALERCLVSGRPLLELAESFRAQVSPFSGYDVRLIEISREPEELRRRIRARTAAMVAGGLVEEVRALRAAGFERNPAVATAVGYRETLAWLDAGGSEAELVEVIVRSTNRLARKQRTWFRSQLPEHHVIEATAEVEGIMNAE